MQVLRLMTFPGIFSILTVAAAAFASTTGAAQSFAVSATPQNTPAGGTGSIQYTVSNIPADGTLIVTCQYAGASTFQAEAKLPICGVGPIVGVPVTAGQTVSGTITMKPWGTPEPLVQPGREQGAAPASALAVAAALLLGLSLRRRSWLMLVLVAAGALTMAAGLAACGGSSNGPTPGIYPYTVTAGDEPNSVTPLGQAVSTTVYITVI